jgi:threonine/homoserine/homoserine lactone efflux protein
MLEILIAGIVLGVTLAFMVGPVFLLLIDIALNKGARKALVFDAGVISADILFVILIWFGADFIKIQEHAIWVYGIGGLLIAAFGVYNVISANRKKKNPALAKAAEQKDTSYEVYYIKGFAMNFLNMGVLAYWLTTSLVMKATVNDDSTLLLIYFTATILAYLLTDVAKIAFAKKLKEKLTPAILLKIEQTVGVILIGFGVLMIARGYLNEMGYSINEFLNVG